VICRRPSRRVSTQEGEPQHRARLPKHLPRCEQVLEPDATACRCCEGRLHKNRRGCSEVLDVIPAILRVCARSVPNCLPRLHRWRGAGEGAAATDRERHGSTALVTHVWLSKVCPGICRCIGRCRFLASQAFIRPRDAAGWVKACRMVAQELYELQLRTIQASPRLFCDETPMPVLDPRRRRTASASSGRMPWMTEPWGGPAPPAVALCVRDGRHRGDRRTIGRAFPAFCKVRTAMPPTRRLPVSMAARSSSLFV